jgi:hypothetical protein
MSVPSRPIVLALGRATVLIAAGLAPALIAPTSAAAAPVRTVRITVATDGTQADGDSLVTAVSANGRYVAFDSGATNLVPR